MKLPGYAQLPLVLLGLVLVFAAIGHLSVGETSTADPLPFDPLSTEERQTAIDIALADRGITSQLGERYVVIGASLNTDKDAMMQDAPPRRADVQLYGYTRDVPILAVVDLDVGAVAGIVPMPHYQPPLVHTEVDRAGELAAAYLGVDSRLPGEHEIVHVAHLWTGPESGCPGNHRCVSVGHYIDDFPDFSFFVLVDLSADEVIEIIENDWWKEEADA